MNFPLWKLGFLALIALKFRLCNIDRAPILKCEIIVQYFSVIYIDNVMSIA